MARSVAAGVDGSPESLAAAGWAAREAVLRDLPLWLVYADETLTTKASSLPELAVPRERAEDMLDRSRSLLSACHPGLTVEADRIVQNPREALRAVTEQAELLVLGSVGLSGAAGFLLGSVGHATVARAHCPVVLVRADGVNGADDVHRADGVDRADAARQEPVQEVLLGVDLRQSCDPVIKFAFDAANRHGATLRVVHAWHLPPALYPPDTAPGTAPGEDTERTKTLAAVLRPWRQSFPDVHITETVLYGRPARRLVHATGTAGLTVLGRRTRHPHIGARIGPVAQAVLHHARCPVAVVPHD
ncbi:universal stress protein [Streptomyces sp. NPDC054796]